ncbi:glycosyltransferase family 39 protein [Kitasatospora sp. LaBMicrA B282]|uniref:glycosyltransferase family 39 protein n=1 Tax=Kitasatospora sp. LaBMicrA B282 TaxID=3420949 RepID=UPI003D0F2B4C
MTETVVADHPTIAAAPDDRPAPSAWRTRFDRTLWLWPALLTLGFGLRGIGRPTLWRDELASWSAASRSTGELLDMLKNVDAVSGAYYLLLHFWIGLLGDSPTVLRLPAALAMAGSAVLVVFIGRRLFDRWTALIAGLLFALVPSISLYSQQVRGYAFVVLMVSAATLTLLRALERPTWWRWAGYALCVTGAGLFHLISVVFLLPHAIVLVLRWRRSGERRVIRRFPVAVALGLLPLVPLAVLGRQQVGRQISWIVTPDMQSFPALWSGLFFSPLVAGIVLAMSVLPLAWSTDRRRAVETGMIAALPIAAIYLISQGSTSYFLDRYVLFTVPAWCVLSAAAITALRPRVVMAVVFVVGTALLGITDQRGLRGVGSHESVDDKGAAAIVAQGYRPGDAIVPDRGSKSFMMLDLAMRYYLPRQVEPVDIFAARSEVRNDDLYAVECGDPAACIGDVQRVWVVTYSDADGKDPYANLPAREVAALKAVFEPVEVQQVRQLTVALLERKDAQGG